MCGDVVRRCSVPGLLAENASTFCQSGLPSGPRMRALGKPASDRASGKMNRRALRENFRALTVAAGRKLKPRNRGPYSPPSDCLRPKRSASTRDGLVKLRDCDLAPDQGIGTPTHASAKLARVMYRPAAAFSVDNGCGVPTPLGNWAGRNLGLEHSTCFWRRASRRLSRSNHALSDSATKRRWPHVARVEAIGLQHCFRDGRKRARLPPTYRYWRSGRGPAGLPVRTRRASSTKIEALPHAVDVASRRWPRRSISTTTSGRPTLTRVVANSSTAVLSAWKWRWKPVSIDVLLNLQAGREPLAPY